MRLRLLSICIAWSLSWMVHAAEQCGSLENGYGPFDYRVNKGELGQVERFHFDAGVENLTRGLSGPLGGDLDYTLRAFPNHHRALQSMARLSERLKTWQPAGAVYPVPCYFERAARFRPDDSFVRLLYGNYLAKIGKPREALGQLHIAEKLMVENANLHYNLGLIYLSLKDYDRALQYAHRAYKLGWQLPGLRNMLQRAGKWQDPRSEEAGIVDAPAPASAPEVKP
jgi:tetratricopeptide (TPR) repeat protein